MDNRKNDKKLQNVVTEVNFDRSLFTFILECRYTKIGRKSISEIAIIIKNPKCLNEWKNMVINT